MAIIDFFDRGWSIDPSATAYVAGEQQWTFDEAYRLSCRIANALLRDGVGRGSKCAVLAGNDPTAWIVVLGIWRANAAFVPLNPRSVPAETASLLAAFDCDTLFYQAPFAPLVEAIRPGLPQLARAICIDADANGTVSLDQWLADFSDAVPHVDIDLDDVISISPTGGTTGRPKGVMNTHRSFQTSMAHLMIANAYTDDERPVNLAAAPMTHSAGLLTLPVSARAGTVVVLTRPDPEALLAAIEQHRVTEFFLPPTVIYGLLQLPGIANHDYSSLRYFSYGAAPMAVGKLKEAVRVFGPVMTGFYGQSEAPLTIAALPREAHVDADDDTLSSVGVPLPLVRVSIRNDNGEIVPAGETGEICVAGDLVMAGYYKDPARTAETIVDGWLHTGDLGHLDARGRLHITDRKKDMIISGGFNIFPSEIEQVIWSHPAVSDCAVIGVPDEKWGEAVQAVVECKPGSSVTPEDLAVLCRERLGSVKTPKSFRFVDSLPRSTVGKVLKKDLRG